jgi:hypothetical protein
MKDRRSRLLGDIDVSQCVGIEIGALHSPIVARSQGRVFYVDYAPTETLRANLKHPDVDPTDVVEVDIVWGERPLGEVIAEPVDYAVASHVIEHVPDLIGWLLELHAALKPNGILGLAVPDRRHTFDIRRNESGLAEMVEAYLRGYREPSLRQVFESAALSQNSADDETSRADHPQGGLPREVLERLPGLYAWAKILAAAPSYVDAHCWVFTPASFLDTAEALVRIGCFPYAIAAFFPTEPGAIEFLVRLQALPDSADPAITASIATARQLLPKSDQPTAAHLARITELERCNEELKATLEAMRNSTSWRLMEPVRSALHFVRRGLRASPGRAGDP